MAIRYDKKFNNEIKRVVRNFNQKIARLEKSERDLILPEKVSIKDIKSNVSSRRDIRNKLKELQLYSERGIEETVTLDNFKISKYELEKTKKSLKSAKSYLTRYIKKIENTTPTSFGIPESTTYAKMGSVQLNNLRARRAHLNVKSLKSLNKEQFEKIQKYVEAERYRSKEMPEIFMNNYLDKMLFSVAYFSDYDTEKINIMKNKLMQLDEKSFLNLFDTEEAIRSVVDWYKYSQESKTGSGSTDINKLLDDLYENLDGIIADYKK